MLAHTTIYKVTDGGKAADKNSSKWQKKNELKADWMMIKVIEQSRTSFPGQKSEIFFSFILWWLDGGETNFIRWRVRVQSR